MRTLQGNALLKMLFRRFPCASKSPSPDSHGIERSLRPGHCVNLLIPEDLKAKVFPSFFDPFSGLEFLTDPLHSSFKVCFFNKHKVIELFVKGKIDMIRAEST